MGRPPNANAAETRRRIVRAATTRFGRSGLAGTSLRAIASDVGVTFATVHHHFGNKAGLYDRCLEEGYAQLASLPQALLGGLGEGSEEERLRRLVALALEASLARREVSRFLLRATLYETEGPSRERIEQAQRSYLDVGSQVLGAALGRPPAALRLPLQGLMILLTRLAVMDDNQRASLAASDAEIERYVGDVAVATLLGGSDDDDAE